MSQYPVEDKSSIIDGVNYLLSGPAGLGQNFQGFSSYTPVYIKPTNRAPFTLPLDTTNNVKWYVAPIPLSNAIPLGNISNSYETEFVYSSAQSPAPFGAGDRINVLNVDPAFYNGTYNSTSSGNTTQVTGITTRGFDATGETYVSGGTISWDQSDRQTSTDCNAFVNILGPTDQAFLSAQLKLDYDWIANTASEFDVVVSIDRLRGSLVSTSETAVEYPDQYLFQTDQTISLQRFHHSESSNGSANLQAIFNTVLDTPGFGYYWYILDVNFVTQPWYNSDQVGGPVVSGGMLGEDAYVSTATGFPLNVSGNIDPTTQGYTYSGVTPVTVTGTGSGAVLSILLQTDSPEVIYYTRANTIINPSTPGSGYQVGDVVKVLGTDFGGASPDNDLFITIGKVQYAGNAKPGEFVAGLRSLTAQVVKE